MRLTYAIGVTLSGTDYLRVFGQDDGLVPVGNSPAGKELLKTWKYTEAQSEHWTDVPGGPGWEHLNAALMIADLDKYMIAWDRQLRSALIACHQHVKDIAKLPTADFEAMLCGLSAVVQELLPGQHLNFVINMNMGRWKKVDEVHLKAMIRDHSLYLRTMAPWHMPPVHERVAAGFSTQVYYRHHDKLPYLFSELRSMTDEKTARFFPVSVPGSPTGVDIDWQGNANVPCVYAGGRLNGLDEKQVLHCCVAMDSFLKGAGVEGYNFSIAPSFDGPAPAPPPQLSLTPAPAGTTAVQLFVRGFADLGALCEDIKTRCKVKVYTARPLCERVTSCSKRSAILEVQAEGAAVLQSLHREQLRMGKGTVYFAASWSRGNNSGWHANSGLNGSGAASSTPQGYTAAAPAQTIERKPLNLLPRSTPSSGSGGGSSSGCGAPTAPCSAPSKCKPNPFGGAKPVETPARWN